MSIAFKDHFSSHADDYSKYRPHYPAKLFLYLASLSTDHQKAWDCATGNGQSALMLTDYFSEVIATDASRNQIESAIQKQGITYRVVTAEHSEIKADSVDLLTVAQAFHWFNREAFAKEAKRVLRNKGIVAIWTYNLLSVNPDLDEIINNLYESTLGEYWAFERKLVEEGYKKVQLPFSEITTPEFQMLADWDLSQLIGYLCTWSAVKKYQQVNGVNPVEAIYREILKVWGDSEKVLSITWPLRLRVWKKA